MPFASTLTGIITAVAAVITALALLAGAMPLLIRTLRQLKEVHTIVNQQRTDAQNYQRALVDALTKAGIDVPADQSLPAPTVEGGKP
jgi:hypothetical protein